MSSAAVSSPTAQPESPKYDENHVATICRFRPPRDPSTKWSQDQYKTDLEKYSSVLPPSADNAELFNVVGRPLVNQTLSGHNATLLAFGQSGSGKTHSLIGTRSDPGLLPRSVNYLFEKCNANKKAMRFRVSISIVEVYMEEIRDLMLSENNSTNKSGTSSNTLRLREKNELFFLPDVTIKVCSTAEAVIREVDAAFKNRTSGQSYINPESSRAHAIATVSIAAETNVRGSAPVLMLSRMSFVDLCGTEVLSDKFGAQQQSETKSINTSLLGLTRVVSALAEKASFINYRDCVLTQLLKSTLSRDSMNAIVVTCSPDPSDAKLTQGAISFGQTAQRIEQHITRRIFMREKGGKIKMKDEADETTIKLEDVEKMKKDQPSSAETRIVATRISIATRQGEISTAFFAREGVLPEQVIASGKVAMSLHAFGGGCCGRDMLDLCTPTIENGTVEGCFAPDMPGFGNTPGSRQGSRTEGLWEKDGPMEIVVDLLDHITDNKKSRQVLFISWDWGANMSLSLAVSPFKTRVRALILFHPSWTSPHEQLAPVKVPVLMLWNPNDTLHLIAHGRKMAKIMPKSKLVSVKPKAGGRGRESYDDIWAIMAVQIAQFTKALPVLAGPKPVKKPETVVAEEKAAVPTPVVKKDDANESSSTSSDEEEGFGDDYEDEGGMGDALSSLEDMSDFSRESSFLGVILADPEVVDAVVAGERSKQLKKQTKALLKEVNADPSSHALFEKLSSLKNANPTSPQRDRILAIVRTIFDICKVNTKTRLALAYALLGRDGALKSSIIGAIGMCPPLLPYSKAETFLNLGYLDQVPRGAHSPSWARSRLHRFLPGRTVMVGVPADLVCQDMRNRERLGRLLSGVTEQTLQSKFSIMTAGNRFYSFRCRIVAPVSADAYRVEIESHDGTYKQFTASLSQIEKMNSPTSFPVGPSKLSLVFEDAIRGRYDNLVMRTKLAQCCQSIAAILPKMDFNAAWAERTSSSPPKTADKNNELLKLQIKCVEILRGCVDIHHHVARGKDPNRALVPDIGSLATYGQFHCHGLASTFAGILLPFCAILGLDVRQRDGFYVKGSSGWDGTPARSADHTWCEITFHPSGANFVTDPSFSPGFGDDIVTKYSDAYCESGCRYPTRDLTSAAESRVLMDSKQCYLIHEEKVATAVTEIAKMKKLVWSDYQFGLSFE